MKARYKFLLAFTGACLTTGAIITSVCLGQKSQQHEEEKKDDQKKIETLTNAVQTLNSKIEHYQHKETAHVFLLHEKKDKIKALENQLEETKANNEGLVKDGIETKQDNENLKSNIASKNQQLEICNAAAKPDIYVESDNSLDNDHLVSQIIKLEHDKVLLNDEIQHRTNESHVLRHAYNTLVTGHSKLVNENHLLKSQLGCLQNTSGTNCQ